MALELTQAEQLIMKCIWSGDESLSIAEIVDILKYQYQKEYAHATVATFLTILEKKGFVEHFKKSHAYRYYATVREEEYKKAQLKGIKDNWYRGSTYCLMASLVGTEGLTEEEIKKMRKMLDEYSN